MPRTVGVPSPLTMLAASSLATVGAVSVLALSAPVHVTVTAATHTPKINARWNYTVKETAAGKPASGKTTVQIVDPIGGVVRGQQ